MVRTIVEDEDEGRTVGQAGTRPLSTGTRAELDQAGLSPSVIELLPRSSKDRHVYMLMMLRICLIELRKVPSNVSERHLETRIYAGLLPGQDGHNVQGA